MSLIYVHPKSNGKLFQCGKAEILNTVKNNRIDILILSAQEFQPDSKNFTPEAKNLLNSTTIYYLPLLDTNQMSLSDLQKVNQLADICSVAIANGKNVLSTCRAGRNRSGLISGIIIKKLTGASGDDIVNHIRTYRLPNALSNGLFVKILKNMKS